MKYQTRPKLTTQLAAWSAARSFSVWAFIMLTSLLWLLSLSNSPSFAADGLSSKPLPKCVYVASYAAGYDWQDRLEKALVERLQAHCTIQTFYMDSKQLKNRQQLTEIGLQAKAFIERHNPDVLIVSDDNAARYVLLEHYANQPLPVVFSGINNSGTNYGLPFRNTSGMIEISPHKKLFEILFKYSPSKTQIGLLTTTGTTAEKNIAEFHNTIRAQGLSHSSAYRAHTQQDWRQLYQKMQQDPKVDFIILDNNAAFKQWDHPRNLAWVKQHLHKPTIATQEWMLPYSTIGYTKVPEEHGRWAADVAIEVLNNTPIHYFPVVPNQKFTLWKNPSLIEHLDTPLPTNFLLQARLFNSKQQP